MPIPDWSTLTADQQYQLAASPSTEHDVGCELLADDLSVIEDISGDLDPNGADIAWTGNSTVHRDCQVTLARRLMWGTALLRIYRVYTDTVGGLTARSNRGVFVLTAPQQPAADDPVRYQVTGQDRTYLLDRQVGYSYSVAAGADVLTAIRQVFTDAGLTGLLVDTTAAGATVPADMVWPLVPVASTTSATPTDTVTPEAPSDFGATTDNTSGPSTWRRIVNDLIGLIGYRAVWADGDGRYRITPYTAPASRPVQFTFDSDDEIDSMVGIERMVTRDLWAAPNKWVFVNSTLPDVVTGTDGDGNDITAPATPTEGAGIYTVVNQSDGPASIDGRNGQVWPTQVKFSASDQAALMAMGDAQVASDRRVTATADVVTVAFPMSHYDVFAWNDEALDEGSWKVEVQSWTEPLDSPDMTGVTWQMVT